MSQALISVVQGDHNYDLNFTVTDAQGVAVDLTGATLTFEAQLLSDLTIHFSGSMAIVTAASGKCKYTVQSSDFPVAGEYNCQIVVVFSGPGEQITVPDILVSVEAAVPVS